MDDLFAQLKKDHPVASAVGEFTGLILDVALIRLGMQRGGLWLLASAVGMYDAARRLNVMTADRGHHPRCPNNPANVATEPPARSEAPPDSELAPT